MTGRSERTGDRGSRKGQNGERLINEAKEF